MLSLAVVAALVVAAPPAKPADKTGRITLWVGNKVVQFQPDGSDLISTPAPDLKNPIGSVICFKPRRKITANIESLNKGQGAKFDGKLVVTPLDEYSKRFTLDGYVVTSFVPSEDGSHLYFNGCEGEEMDKNKWTKGFILDLETRKVKPVPLPDNHIFKAVSPDGKAFITLRHDIGKGATSQAYLIRDGGKPVEILKENTSLYKPLFSPDGSKVFIETSSTERDPGMPSPREVVVLHVATRVTKRIRDLPPGGRHAYAWSPDGTKWACLCVDSLPGAGAGGRIQFEHKVFVSDLDGGNRKEIYKADVPGNQYSPFVFQWK
jgi:hypothetical protein